MGRKKTLILALIILGLVAFLALVILPKTGFAISRDETIDVNYLNKLKQNAGVECLQNSQCADDFECISNSCVDKKKINPCQSVNLYTPTRKIKYGDSINSVKEVLTKDQLPYLLSDSELVEIIDDKIIEYFYSSIILIGDNKVEKENNEYIIKNNAPVYTYKLTFSKPVDFSNKNIHGQTLRLFGEEYVISEESDNPEIKLISNKKTIILEDRGNTGIYRDEKGNVVRVEILFNSLENIRADNSFSDSTFNSVKLSFQQTDDSFADVKFGGVCW